MINSDFTELRMIWRDYKTEMRATETTNEEKYEEDEWENEG